jgi:lysophospholipase L1-like esterase
MKNCNKIRLLLSVIIIAIIGFLAITLINHKSKKVIKPMAKINHIPYAFIRYDKNIIDFYGNKSLEKKFSILIDQAKNGQKSLKILHIGDSHIQADVFTGETRRLLSSWFEDNHAARGFTFPYQIIGSNNPDDFDVTWKGQWQKDTSVRNSGIAGLTLQSTDTNSEFTIKLKDQESESGFDIVRIMYSSKRGDISPFLKEKAILVENKGSSALFKLLEPRYEVTIAFDRKGEVNETLNLYGVELTNSKSKVDYSAAGVNGASVKTFINSNHFIKQVSELSPSIVIVSLGTNDVYNPNFNAAEFKQNFSSLVKIIKRSSKESIVILTTPGDHLVNRETKNSFLLEAQAQIKIVAKDLGCGTWDFYEIMGGDGSVEQWANSGLCAPDKLHLNRMGYRLKGTLFFDALVKLSETESMLQFTNQPSNNE